MIVQYARNPKRVSPTKINLNVKFRGMNEMEFTADATDSEAHGRELYDNAVKGVYGTVK